MGKKTSWTPEEDAILREFYISAPIGRRYSSAYKKLPGRTKDAMSGRARYSGLVSDDKTRVITAFLEAAATIPDKNRRTWRMVPEEATEEMKLEGQDDVGWEDGPTGMTLEIGVERIYRAMLAAAPKFEVGT